MQENEINEFDELAAKADAAVARFNDLGDSIKAAEQRMREIADLKKHIVNYSKTREVYVAYRKAGYSRKFFEEHREAVTLHKAAKEAFERLGFQKLPRVKGVKRRVYPTVRAEKGGVSSLPESENRDAGVSCGAESGGGASGKRERIGGYGGAAQAGTTQRTGQMLALSRKKPFWVQQKSPI